MKDEGGRLNGRPARTFHPSSFLLYPLHTDQSGSISLATVFALLLLTMLLGMVINVGRQVDNKVKLQNAADTATYSGGVVLARGMNSLAFTNHMLTEVFALTAFMREVRDRHAEPFVPEILAAWDGIGPVLANSGFQKFDKLGPSDSAKDAAEQQMVTRYGDWMAASSDIVLPVLEDILSQEMIPQLQRQIVAVTPAIAQTATASLAKRNTGQPSPRAICHAVRSSVSCGERSSIRSAARANRCPRDAACDRPRQRRTILAASGHRSQQQRPPLSAALERGADAPVRSLCEDVAIRSAVGGFTCGQLQQLIDQYPSSNLPHLIRQPTLPRDDNQALVRDQQLEQDYMFVGVAYRPKLRPSMPKLFTDSLLADNEAFAQGMLFVPRHRPVDLRPIRFGRANGSSISTACRRLGTCGTRTGRFSLCRPRRSASLRSCKLRHKRPPASGANLHLPMCKGFR